MPQSILSLPPEIVSLPLPSRTAAIAVTFEVMNWMLKAAGSHSKNYLPSVDLRSFGDLGGIQAVERPWRAVLRRELQLLGHCSSTKLRDQFAESVGQDDECVWFKLFRTGVWLEAELLDRFVDLCFRKIAEVVAQSDSKVFAAVREDAANEFVEELAVDDFGLSFQVGQDADDS